MQNVHSILAQNRFYQATEGKGGIASQVLPFKIRPARFFPTRLPD